MKKLAISIVLLLAWSAAIGVQPAGQAASQPTTGPAVMVTLLHINDPHGHLEPYTLNGKSVGGYARLATVVQEVREANEAVRTFLLHAGDELSRGDALTRSTLGKVNVDIMNKIGFDFWTPGNGDFYDGIGVLQGLIQRAKFTVLAANVALQDSGECIAKPYAIEQVGPAKLAFLGLCTVRTQEPSAAGLAVANAMEVAAKLVPKLRGQADVVIVVSHLGYDQDILLANRVAGIDIIIGGHTHTKLPTGTLIRRLDGKAVLICQADEYLTHVGRVEVKLSPQDGRYTVASAAAKLIPLDGQVKLDPAITAIIARASSAASQPAGVK